MFKHSCILAVYLLMITATSTAAQPRLPVEELGADPVRFRMGILERRLGISGEVREKIRAVVEDHVRQEAGNVSNQGAGDRQAAAAARLRDKILPLLTPEQKLAAAVSPQLFRIIRLLDLTPEQTTRLAEFAIADQNAGVSELPDRRSNPTAYFSALHALLKKRADAARSILTPDQVAKLDSLLKSPPRRNPLLDNPVFQAARQARPVAKTLGGHPIDGNGDAK